MSAHHMGRGPCHDCGTGTLLEDYMVHDHLWKRAGMTDGLLCVGCIEKRLGRELWAGDFTHYPCNLANYDQVANWLRRSRSDRLQDRLTRPRPRRVRVTS